MPKHRFFLEPERWSAELIRLSPEESHHCRDVLRCEAGDRVAVFDGVGREAEVEIVSLSKNSVELAVISQGETSELPASITLGQAIPKGKNMELIIQKATELGVSRIVPLETRNTVIKMGSQKDREKKQEKWQRVAVEACKQCGQNWLPEVGMPVGLSQFVGSSGDCLKVVAAIGEKSSSLKSILARESEKGTHPRSASVLIGPEGDFTTGEVEEAIESGFLPMSLGPIILRSETAAIYSVSVLAYELMNR